MNRRWRNERLLYYLRTKAMRGKTKEKNWIQRTRCFSSLSPCPFLLSSASIGVYAVRCVCVLSFRLKSAFQTFKLSSSSEIANTLGQFAGWFFRYPHPTHTARAHKLSVSLALFHPHHIRICLFLCLREERTLPLTCNIDVLIEKNWMRYLHILLLRPRRQSDLLLHRNLTHCFGFRFF